MLGGALEGFYRPVESVTFCNQQRDYVVGLHSSRSYHSSLLLTDFAGLPAQQMQRIDFAGNRNHGLGEHNVESFGMTPNAAG